jgi:hypothetical protein
MEIICDTNVWYGLASGELDLNDVRNFDLVLTASALLEMAQSENLYTRPLLVREAARIALSECSRIELRLPLEILANDIFDNFKPNYNYTNTLVEELRIFSRLPDKILHSRRNMRLFQEIREGKKALFDLTDMINNEILEKVRINLQDRSKRTKHKQTDKNDGVLDLIIINLCNKFPELKRRTLIESRLGLEAFVDCAGFFYRKLELSKTMKFDANDWFDLFNVTYLNEDNMYFTFEERWKSIIRESGYSNKIFQL